MRRLTILLAAVGALLLIPAAQAFAENGTVIVNVAGTGAGEVSSVGGLEGSEEFEGSPPIECSYASPGPKSGVCENEASELFEPLSVVYLHPIAAPGSHFVGYTTQKGLKEGEWCNGNGFRAAHECAAIAVEGLDGNVAEVTAVFDLVEKLTVTKEGTGSGTVVSSPVGIECGETCGADMSKGAVVTLTASPGPSSAFVSWKGCDKGGVNGRQCTVTMSAAKSVSAKFTKAYEVGVSKSGSGLGKVSSSPGGLICLNNCSTTTAAFKEGTSVTLTAVPAKHNTFVEWTGACSGSGTCSLTMSEARFVGAKFAPVSQFGLGVIKSGGGNGTVKSNLAGINCGATCSQMTASYYAGEEVELTAIPGKGSTFGGWTEGPCTGTGTCKVTMGAAKSVTAFFK